MRIGEMSQLFDIPVETLRWYEQQGILKPQRTPGSKYRDYSFEDCFSIYESLSLRNMGIGVKQTAALLNGRSLSELLDQMRERQKAIAKEVRYQQAILDHLQTRVRDIERFQMNMEDRWFSHRPAYAYLPFSIADYNSMASSELFAQWMAHAPLVSMGGHIRLKEGAGPDGQISGEMEFALIAEQHLLELLELPMDGRVQFVPERLCMHTIIYVDRIWDNLEVLKPSLEDMARRGYGLDGGLTDLIIVKERREREQRLWHSIFLPVKKLEI